MKGIIRKKAENIAQKKSYINKGIILILLINMFCFKINAALPEGIDRSSGFGFEENKGQIFDETGKPRSDVYFVAHFSGANIFFTNNGVVFDFYKVEPSRYEKILSGKIPNPYSEKEWEDIRHKFSNGEYNEDDVKAKGEHYRVDITFPGANLNKPDGEQEELEKHNYYNPHYPDGLRDVSLFKKIRFKNVYKGTDLVFYVNNGQLKYDFEVSANADPSLIKILYKGHEHIEIDQKGDARIKILPGEIIEKAPVSIQNGKIIESKFRVNNDTIEIQTGDYDHTQPLTIDPALAWATYFYDGITSAAFTYTNPVWDSNGNMFMVFDTYNTTTFPLVNPGGSSYYQSTPGSTGLQFVIMKLNTSRQIIWATYYASSQSASTNFTNHGLAIDQSDNIYTVGNVFYVYGSPAPSFPLYNPGGAYYETTQGNSRNFILKFSSSGQRLWATMFNTTGASSSGLNLYGVTIDKNNKLLISGTTYTPASWQPIPLATPGGSYYYKSAPPESQVPSLHRFNTSGALEWSTYVSQGASGTYCGSFSSVAVDASNNIFMASDANSAYTLVNPGSAYQDGTVTGGRKISIFKFASVGSISWCTLYGGTTSANSILWQDVRDLKVASNGDVFLAGRVNTTNFPTYDPGGAYIKSTLSTGSTSVCDGVIMQFSNNGVRKWATYYGGNGTSDGTDFMGLGIDGSNNIVVSGISRSTSFPTLFKAGSYNQSAMSADYAIVLAQFNINGVRQWASYFGTQTYMLSGGFGIANGLCGQTKLMQFGYVENAYSITTSDPGAGAYYQSGKEGATGQTDIFVELADGGSSGTPGVWTWTGNVNTDWFQPCNWDKLSVPVATSPVIIPGAPSNQPVIANGNAHCLSIEVQSSSGASLNINTASGNLEVHQ